MNRWLEKVKKLNWKKAAKVAGVGVAVVAGNAIAGEVIYQTYQEAARANARIRVLEQHLADTDFGLCLALRQNMPSSIEEDEEWCTDWVRERINRFRNEKP
jgi:hypothetical protein